MTGITRFGGTVTAQLLSGRELLFILAMPTAAIMPSPSHLKG